MSARPHERGNHDGRMEQRREEHTGGQTTRRRVRRLRRDLRTHGGDSGSPTSPTSVIPAALIAAITRSTSP